MNDLNRNDRVFVIMQVGGKDSPERKRAEEVYNFIVAPAVKAAGLEPYRADLDFSPGAVTAKMLSELVNARAVIADLTGRNPNVFYELGIAHSFTRPLISIADSSSHLPFDAKDERVIELGEYPLSGLTYAQGERAKAYLHESLAIVLSETYVPPSPLREVAANHSVDELAPGNPLAAEMIQIRETLEEIRKRVVQKPGDVSPDVLALREVVSRNSGYLDESDFGILINENTSNLHDQWVIDLQAEMEKRAHPKRDEDPWSSNSSGYSDEPPF